MDKLKVVNIGGFGHADAVFRDLVTIRDAELIGLAPAYEDEDISTFMGLQPASGKKVYDSYAKMLKQLKPDVTIVSTRLDVIPQVIIDAADAGCHIITEKPLALDLATLEKVQEAVIRNNINLMAMLTMRSKPQFIAAKQVYDSGAVGEAVLINARKSYKWGTRPEWFGDGNKYGGTIGWVGIHAIDFINYITGLCFTKVASMKSNLTHNERPGCEDNCALILEMSNRGHATVSIDYCRPETSEGHGDDWIRIVGTNGILEAGCVKGECSVITTDKGEYKQPLPNGKDGIFCKFLRNILEGKSNTAIQDKSFMLTKVCLLARKAAEQNKVINITRKNTSPFLDIK